MAIAENSYFSPIKIITYKIEREIKKFAASYARGSLVDTGCGTKPYEKIFKPFVDSYFGLDFKESSAYHYAAGTRADLYCDCCDTGLQENSFDTLISTQVLEHVFDFNSYIKECRRILKNGGRAFFTVPFFYPCHAVPNDYFRFTPYALEKIFTRNGFKIITIYGCGYAFSVAGQTLILALLSRAKKGSAFIRRVKMTFAIRVMVPLINIFFLFMDSLCDEQDMCLEYIIIAEK